MPGARVLALLLVATALGVVSGPARADGIFICDTTDINHTSCSHFTATLDGVATFESLGLSSTAIEEAVGWGVGVELVFFAIGLAVGCSHKGLSIAFGSREGV